MANATLLTALVLLGALFTLRGAVACPTNPGLEICAARDHEANVLETFPSLCHLTESNAELSNDKYIFLHNGPCQSTLQDKSSQTSRRISRQAILTVNSSTAAKNVTVVATAGNLTAVPIAVPAASQASALAALPNMTGLPPTSVNLTVQPVTVVPAVVPPEVQAAVQAAVQVAVSSAVPAAVSAAVPAAVRSAVPAAVSASVSGAVPTAVRSAVPAAVSAAVSAAVPAAVRAAIPAAISAALPAAVNSSVSAAVNSTVSAAVSSAVPAAVNSALPAAVSAAVSAAVPVAVQAAVQASVPAVGPAIIPASVSAPVPAAVPVAVPAIVPAIVPAAVPAIKFADVEYVVVQDKTWQCQPTLSGSVSINCIGATTNIPSNATITSLSPLEVCKWKFPKFCDQATNMFATYMQRQKLSSVVRPVTPADYTLYPGVASYKVYTTAKNWIDAQAACVADGSNLVVPGTAAEYNAILDMMQKANIGVGQAVYVGFNDVAREGYFRTVFGQPMCSLQRMQWAAGQPDNLNGTENCVALSNDAAGATLQDVNCSLSRAFICEKAAAEMLAPC